MVVCTAQRGAWDHGSPNAGRRSRRGWQQEGAAGGGGSVCRSEAAAALHTKLGEMVACSLPIERGGSLPCTCTAQGILPRAFCYMSSCPAGEAPTRRQALQLATSLAVAPLLAGSAQAAKGERGGGSKLQKALHLSSLLRTTVHLTRCTMWARPGPLDNPLPLPTPFWSCCPCSCVPCRPQGLCAGEGLPGRLLVPVPLRLAGAAGCSGAAELGTEHGLAGGACSSPPDIIPHVHAPTTRCKSCELPLAQVLLPACRRCRPCRRRCLWMGRMWCTRM